MVGARWLESAGKETTGGVRSTRLEMASVIEVSILTRFCHSQVVVAVARSRRMGVVRARPPTLRQH